MTRMLAFSDCGLCNGTGLVENMTTGARESCSRCADRAARAREADMLSAPVRRVRFAASPSTSATRSANSEQWTPERAATFLKVGLWLILGAGGVALVHFAGSNEENRTRALSDGMEAPRPDSPGSDGPAEYFTWEPEQ
jgi:hypothetical protein